MASVNKVIIIGNLGAEPEINEHNGRKVCNLSIATNETWKDKDTGEKKEKAEWHRVSVWGNQAEPCMKYLTKGRQVYVEGKLETRKWEDKSGVTRYSTSIIATTVQFLGGKSDGGGGDSRDRGGYNNNHDDIPF